MATLRVGCPMWAHRPWVGTFFPSGLKAGQELSAYVQWCNAVEGNTTFYAEPSRRNVERWAEQSPSDFRFAFKLPRTITHDKRLRDVRAEVRSFLTAIEPLGERVGPLQVQLPGSFGPDSIDALRAFVPRLPTDWRWAVELRHRAFFDDGEAHRSVDELLRHHDVGRVMLDTRPLHAGPIDTDAARDEVRSKPLLPLATDGAGSLPIVRLIGHDDAQITLDGLRAWQPAVRAWLADGKEPYVFVHQPANLDGPGLAQAFHEEMCQIVDGLTPLPTPGGQATMF